MTFDSSESKSQNKNVCMQELELEILVSQTATFFTHTDISQVKQHYLGWIPATNRSNSDRQDRADVGSHLLCTHAAVKLMEISLFSHWLTVLPCLFPLPPHCHSVYFPLPYYPAPVAHLFTLCDVTASSNGLLFRASTLLPPFATGKPGRTSSPWGNGQQSGSQHINLQKHDIIHKTPLWHTE